MTIGARGQDSNPVPPEALPVADQPEEPEQEVWVPFRLRRNTWEEAAQDVHDFLVAAGITDIQLDPEE